MKNKTLPLAVMSVFLVAVFVSLVSATIVLNPNTQSLDVPQGNPNSFTFTINASYPASESALNDLSAVVSDLTGTAGTISSSQVTVGALPVTLNAGATSSAITVTVNAPSSQALGTYTGTITIDADRVNASEQNPQAQSITLTVTVTKPTVTSTNHFCNDGVGPVDNGTYVSADSYTGDLQLNVDVNDKGEGDDDAWLPLDTIQVDVELENNRDKDVSGTDLSDVYFEIGLYEISSTKNIAKDMIWVSSDDEKHKVGSVNADKSKSYTFEFRVDPHEIDNADYNLYVKAYEKGHEDENCIDFSSDLTDFGSSQSYARVGVETEGDTEKMVVVDENSYPETIDAFCGQQASFNADVWNIGDDDFNDQIKVTLVNNELGINEESVIDGDFNAGDDGQASFNFAIPQDAQKKVYTLSMRTFYDYDKDADVYYEVSDNTFYAYLNVQGDCASAGSTSKINARLESGGNAGEDMVVRATLTNSGSSTANYVVNVAGYSNFADSASAAPTSLTLGAGESADVLVTLAVKDDASGSNTFNIEAISGSQVTTQPVTVSIVGKKGVLTGGVIGTNGLAWGLGILSIVLIVAIVIVAMRLRK